MYGVSKLEHVTGEIQADWTKCTPLVGPLPGPDFTVGLQLSAFIDEEIEKFKYNSAPKKPTIFTEDLCFPFFVCEAKMRPTICSLVSYLRIICAARKD